MGREDYLFRQGDLDATLDAHRRTIAPRVDSIPQDQFMNAPPDEVVDNIAADMTIEPLTLYEERAEMEHQETKIDVSRSRDRNPFGDPGPILVSGLEVLVSIPFTGDSSLWTLRPSSSQGNYPNAKVIGAHGKIPGHLHFEFSLPTDEPQEKFKERLDEQLGSIRFYIQAQQPQVSAFNARLRADVLAAVIGRRGRIQKHEGLKDILGIPMKRREGVPAFQPVKIARKLVRPLPPPPKTGYQPEPGITEEDYSHILSVIRHEGRTFETTPKTYAVHDEEELRDILLAHLNGHYQGDATGEAFRRSGKTDIRIEDGNRAAFVAECKIWKGAKELGQAIDQLLGYLTWRDCKAAIVVFNKHNAKFSGILDGIAGVFEGHPCFKRARNTEAGEWQFDMTSREDEGRLVRIHVFVFNLYAKEK